MDTLAFGGTTAQPSHVGLCARLVEKDQRMRIERCATASPALAGKGYVLAVLFAGSECLFLYVRFISASA